MIFVTVGAQMPFDRLVKGVDDWATTRAQSDVYAQIGTTDYRPRAIEWSAFLDPPAFRERIASATAIIAHAGMGSILTALQCGKPILVMPRRGDLRETRNDHQVATAERFKALGRVAVAMNEDELPEQLDRLSSLVATDPITPDASPELIGALTRFIHHGQSEGKTP